jgi:hypothetical protein
LFSTSERRPPVSAKPAQLVNQIEIPKRNPPLEPEPLVEEIKGIRLQMTFIEETWIHVYADGESVWDGVKNKGDTLDIRADEEVRLNVGNAGGPELIINGQKAKPLGPSGAVRLDILITLENYLEFLVPGQEKTG